MRKKAEHREEQRLASAAKAAFEQGRLGDAESRYIELNQRFGPRAEWFANLGAVQLRLGRFEAAVRSLETAAVDLPSHPGVLTSLGMAQLRAGRAEAAVESLRRATALAPSSVDAHNALGLAHAALGDVEQASEAFAAILAHAPDPAQILGNWVEVLIRFQRMEQATDVAIKATRDRPDHPGAWFLLGHIHMLTGELPAALDALTRSADLLPTHSATQHNLGLVLQWMGRLTEAEARFRMALDLDPSNADARFGLGTTLLRERKSEEGWKLFAAGRSGAGDAPSSSVPARRWDGMPIQRGALLVLADQGLGDVIQFARFLAAARERVPRLLMYCSDYYATLVPLLASVQGIDAMVDRNSEAQEVGAFTEMSRLPDLLGLGSTAFDPVPAYIHPPEDARQRWSQRLAIVARPRIGLCWSGNPRPDYADANRIDGRRSIPLARLASIFTIPRISLLSLQAGVAAEALRSAHLALADWTELLRDYGETAALVANLDLVISVDTSIVHCAGAIGTTVWMLDRFDHCWRWSDDAANPGVYRNLRIFRQPAFGDWTAAIGALHVALARWASDWREG